MKNIGYVMMIFLCSFLWGSTYPITKYILGYFTPIRVIAIRFSAASLILFLIYHKRFKGTSKEVYRAAIGMGTVIFLAYLINQTGTIYTDSSKQAFLTGAYVVLVPFFSFVLNKKYPKPKEIFAAFLCFFGISIISGMNDFSNLNLGDMLTLISTFFYAYYIYIVEIWSSKADPLVLSTVQLGTVAVLANIVSIFKPSPLPVELAPYGFLIYLTIFCTLLALPLQNIAQRHVSSNIASIILSLETVFGGMLGIIFLKEPVSFKLIVGAAICFCAIIIANLPAKKKT